MTRLEFYAQLGSCSYGLISPDRLREILLGDKPKAEERASVFQALVETDATALNCAPAQELADELGLTLNQLEARCMTLTQHKLGAASFTELARKTAALDDGTTA